MTVPRSRGKTKALLTAEKRLDMALNAGASPANIDILKLRVEKLGGVPSVNAEAASSNPFAAFAERELKAQAERQAADEATAEILRAAGGEALAAHEPQQVLAVARGRRACWIRAADHANWLIAARADEVSVETVEVWRRDGTSSVERWTEVVASGQVDGVWVAVLRPLPKDFAA